MKDGSDRGVELNYFIALYCHLQVAFLHLLVNPLLEIFADEAMDYVAYESSFKLKRFTFVGECILDVNVLAGEVEDLFDREASVVGHVDWPDVVQVDGNLLIREDVF